MSEINRSELWFSTKEIAEYLGVTMETIRKWIKVDIIPCIRVRKLWKIKKLEVDACVKLCEAVEDK